MLSAAILTAINKSRSERNITTKRYLNIIQAVNQDEPLLNMSGDTDLSQLYLSLCLILGFTYTFEKKVSNKTYCTNCTKLN